MHAERSHLLKGITTTIIPGPGNVALGPLHLYWRPYVFLAATLWLLLSCGDISAQWTNQTIVLHSGWNAVFLEIQPEPSDCDSLFASLSVDSAWAWNRRFSPVQYIQDPTALIPGDPDWLTWLPGSNPNHVAANLFILQANRAYLIKLPDTASPNNWTIRGRPSVRAIDWLS